MKVQVIEKKKGRIDRITGEIIKVNPRVIAFILKSGNEIKCEEDQNQQPSYEASENYLQKVSEPCGVRFYLKT